MTTNPASSSGVRDPARVPRLAEGRLLIEQTTPTKRHVRFLRVVLTVLIDLTVLNLFIEYWDRV
jgi:hypothetical protein